MFDAAVSNTDESRHADERPDAYVLRLAEAKARAALPAARAEHIIIGADTTVADGDDILGKPRDMAEAIVMLKQLRGHTHQVYTGIAALRVADLELAADFCVTDVPMRSYSDEEMESYASSGDPLDKAGAYAIQHPRFQPVENMQGCYASVMGLPLCHLTRLLARFDISPLTDIPTSCQTMLNYSCAVWRVILGEKVG